MKLLTDMVAHHKQGEKTGIYAVCSAHPYVLKAAICFAREQNTPLLVEATSNQVDQFGGYTGMKPTDFRDFIWQLADECHFPRSNLILGGDHLGPNRWQNKCADEAMSNADELIRSYVMAGFKKIHLDCSMSCADDPVPLTDTIVAKRAARLAVIAEETCQQYFGTCDLVYVIGTEVPVPGGAHEELVELEVTTPEAAMATLQAHQIAFSQHNIAHIWPRIIGLVVQPGVEFDHLSVIDYQPEKTRQLSQIVAQQHHLVYEAHSTDYQTPVALGQLVKDHFAILKVGPGLTFALREVLFALAAIEDELIIESERSSLRQVMEMVMSEKPEYWESYYTGDTQTQRIARSYSYSDRIRYYWPDKTITLAVERLLVNLNKITIPLPLISQYLPLQYPKIRAGHLTATPEDLIIAHIQTVLRHYHNACQ